MQHSLHDPFTNTISSYWTQTCVGTGSLIPGHTALRMQVNAIQQGSYADAQIDDYGKKARSAFPWRPPLRMDIRARASHSTTHLQGTAGFGFWNYPFSVRGDILMLPESIWFFYASPPSNMALVPGIPGWGWKAQVVHAMRVDTLFTAIPTALATGWGKLTKNTQLAAHWLQKLSGTHEALLDVPLDTWHTYTLEWNTDAANFWVDDQHVLHAPNPPTRALGFVAWLDNQYAIATPSGQLSFGTVSCPDQWFEIANLSIISL